MITSNIKDVVRDLRAIPARMDALTELYMDRKKDDLLEEGTQIVYQVVYASVPEGEYERRGTSTANLGILNSIVTYNPEPGSMFLGITPESSQAADTIPKTEVGRSLFDTYAGFMITGGGFLEHLGMDVRNFLEVWSRYFLITLPYDYMREVVVKAI